MAVEAPVSRFRKTNLVIYIVVCLGLTLWCVYDGYVNKAFIDKYIDPESGKATGWLVVNRSAPPFLIGAAALMGGYLAFIWKKRIVADDDGLVLSSRSSISYDSIEKIDKTYFDSKGFFVLTYKGADGREYRQKLSKRSYDGLEGLLEHLVAKIS